MMKNIVWLSMFSFALIGCGGESSGSSSSGGTSAQPFAAPTISASNKQAYLEAINVARGNTQYCGSAGDFAATSALAWSDALYKAAYEHSNDMAQSNIFSHTGSGTASDWTSQVLSLGRGSSFNERISNNGYNGFTAVAENITAGTSQDLAREAVAAWLASPPHCAALMNPKYKDVGLAHVGKSGTKFTHYWTQDFGTR